jgi:hypothetical protein
VVCNAIQKLRARNRAEAVTIARDKAWLYGTRGAAALWTKVPFRGTLAVPS